MTLQASDVVIYSEREYDLAGEDGHGLFQPEQHGLTVSFASGWSSNCCRGYQCTYAVTDGRLALSDLCIWLDPQCRPTLFGRLPDRTDSAPYRYTFGAGIPVLFTGGLLMGHGRTDHGLWAIGFYPCWRYRFLHELTFERGILREEVDRSRAAEILRTRIDREDEQLEGFKQSDLNYSLRYDRSWFDH